MDTIAQHISSVQQAIPFLERQDRLFVSSATAEVSGVFNPFAANQLESLTPPRPAVDQLTKKETWYALTRLCEGIQGAVQLGAAKDWSNIEVGLSSPLARYDG